MLLSKDRANATMKKRYDQCQPAPQLEQFDQLSNWKSGTSMRVGTGLGLVGSAPIRTNTGTARININVTLSTHPAERSER